MQSIVAQFLSGLMQAMFLFRPAVDLSLIFGVSRMINISHGAFFTLGADLLLTVSADGALSIPAFFGLVIFGGVAIGALGATFEKAERILRRAYRGGMLFVALVTFGSLLVVEEVVRIIWGADMKATARPRGFSGAITAGGVDFPIYSLVIIAVGLLMALTGMAGGGKHAIRPSDTGRLD